ncbi:Crp/Fnr family transcriptional regulator [Streptosporangium canum]|uniref:Crp/Fnr family transcriptional regulator n=1 Tax=Streptosporangium canum TaxID=324952 RepID=UPI003448EB86
MTKRQPGDLFARGSFLTQLSAPVRERLLDLGTVTQRAAGRDLIRQGAVDDIVFVLMEAITKITARAENGSQVLLAVRVSGDIVGDMAALSGGPRSATVTTCRRSTICAIRGPIFLDFLRRSPEAGLALSRLIGDRLRWANERRLDFAGYDAGIRLARLLLTLSARHGRWGSGELDMGVPLTQAELGELIGAKEVTVQKALRELAERGLIRRVRRGVVITGVAELAELAGTPEMIDQLKPY